MSGVHSAHLVDAYNPHTITNHDGSMMQRISAPQPPFTSFGVEFQSISEETAKKIASLQAKLNRKLGPEYISQRPGPGGGPKLTYVEGWKVINLANEVFGFNGWSSSIVSLSTDFTDYFEDTKRYCIGVTAIVRVTLRDGVFHEDIGYGMLENTKSKGAGLDKCKKEAVTDGLKRALRNFGNVLGNCLYDKAYTAEIVKIKVEPPKFNTSELHRRPEYEGVKPNPPAIPTVKPQPKPLDAANNYTTPSRTPMQENRGQRQNTSDLRTDVQSTSSTFKLPRPPAQLTTPVATPMINPHRPPQQDKRVSFSNAMVRQSERAASPSSVSLKPPKNEIDCDSDDTFGLDEQEFLALADLAADIGRPIDQEGASLTTIHEAKKVETHERVSEQQPQGSTRPGNDATKQSRLISREEVIAAALQGQDGDAASSDPKSTTVPTPAVTITRHPPQPRPAAYSTVSTIPSPCSDSSSKVQQQHQVTAPSMAQRLYQNYMKKQHHRNDSNQNQTNQNGSISGTKNTLAPSMGGGFNFSSGMNATPSSTSSTPIIGVKRPVEALSSGLGLAAQIRAPTTSFRGARPVVHQAPSMTRPVNQSGAVGIADREDVKRIKL